MQAVQPYKLVFLRILILLVITILLSVVITVINSGFTEDFLINWSKGLLVALVVVPLGVRLIPYVSMGVQRTLNIRSMFVMRCVVAVCIAFMMELMVSFAVTLVQLGFSANWYVMWGLAFLKSLPLGLVIGFTMTFIIHPWLGRLALRQSK